MIVDGHIHLLGRMSTVSPAAERLAGRLPEFELGPPEAEAGQRVALMDAAGIDKAVIVNNRSHPDLGVFTPNDVIATEIARFPDRLAGIAGVTIHPKPDLAEMETAVGKLGFRGFKITPAIAYCYPDDFDLLGPLYTKAIELDAPIMWHIGTMGASIARQKFASLDRLAEVIRRYPDLRHIIAHLGGHGPPGIEALVIELAANRPNVYLDASYCVRADVMRHLPLGSRKPAERYTMDVIHPHARWDGQLTDMWNDVRQRQIAIIRQAANMCPDRFLFGSDTPEAISMKLAMDLYQEALGGSEVWDLVMGENAARLLRL